MEGRTEEEVKDKNLMAPCGMIEHFGPATGLRAMKRTIPIWRDKVAELGDEKGSGEWARAELERYKAYGGTAWISPMSKLKKSTGMKTPSGECRYYRLKFKHSEKCVHMHGAGDSQRYRYYTVVL